MQGVGLARSCLALAPLIAATLCPLARGQTSARFQVNSFTPDSQSQPQVAASRDSFVIVWTSNEQDGFSQGVFGRLFNFEAIVQSEDFQVNPYTVGAQSSPAVAMDLGGDFVVVWRSNASPPGILARRFDRFGAAVEPTKIVNFSHQDIQEHPDVTWAGNGFVVVWQSADQDGSGIFGQRFDGEGNTLGHDFMVNSRTAGGQSFPAVDGSSDGSFVVVWTDSSSDGSSWGIFAQRFDRDGVKQAAEFQVNSYTPGSQALARVAVQPPAGCFVVVWQDAEQDGSSFGVFGQRFDEGGTRLASEFQVNVRTLDGQLSPDVAAAQDRGFLVVWESMESSGEAGPITGRWFGIDGDPRGGEFQIDSYPQAQNGGPAAEVNPNGVVVVTWSSRLDSVPSDNDVFARLLPSSSAPGIPALTEPGLIALVVLVTGIGMIILRRTVR